MIFQFTWEDVLSGIKTKTRRIVKPGEDWLTDALGNPSQKAVIKRMPSGNVRIVYEVGHVYAVQPGRGKKSVGRIQIASIRKEDVRKISLEDAQAEGFRSRLDFLRVWCKMHDKIAYAMRDFDFLEHDDTLEHLTNDIAWLHYLYTRPAERYQAWALNIKLVTT